MYKKVSTIINGQEFVIETGKVAKQASGAVWVTFGETVVMVTAVGDQNTREGIDFLPLTVDYQELAYAAGRIPGNFFRREMGRPSERETLTSRLIDRPIRPRMPKGWTFETQIIASVYSVDKVNEPDVMALTGASAALMISDVPFDGPIAGVRVGRVDGEFIINPTAQQRENSDMDIIVGGSRNAVCMVEGGVELLDEEVVLEAIWFGHAGLQPLLDLQEELARELGKPKRSFTPPVTDEDLLAEVRGLAAKGIKDILQTGPKLERYGKVRALKAAVIEALGEAAEGKEGKVKDMVGHLEAEAMRTMILQSGQRVDGRDLTQVRTISCEVGPLPRTHGSALFTRGETQALVTATLGTSGDEQRIETVTQGDIFRRFMLHYNFPPFCVNEAKMLRGPGRREIGHGALARRSLGKVLPDKERFPYSIRVVSDILESNGSSSMATVCGGSLALMDAGVPVGAAVAGVAMGLIMEGDQVAVLTDIIGDEDHLGDMDFKVTGTKNGLAAVQMDIKISGVSKEIMGQALMQAKDGRLFILGEMEKALSTPRASISDWAPRIDTIKIPVERIKDIIGPGGKIIRGIQMETGAKIDVEDDGTVHIAAVEHEAGQKALAMIKELTQEVEEGAEYEGKVVRIMDFGAFVEIMPGRDGMVHISELDHHRVRAVTDVLKEGDIIKVKVLGIDDRGKIRLSRKALLPPPEGGEVPSSPPRGDYRDSRDGRDNRPPPAVKTVIQKTVLDNGVRLLSERLPHAYSVTMGLWMEVGSRDENPDRGGVSHFIEHMAFKGTSRRGPLEIAKEIDRLGGLANAFTSKETTCFHARALAQHLPDLADLLLDIFLCPVFDADELERERQVILQEISCVEDTPDELVHVLFSKNFWSDHPLGRPVLGTAETVTGLNRQAVLDYLHSTYLPQSLVVAAVGDLEHEQLVDLIGPALAKLPSASAPARRRPPEPSSGPNVVKRKLEQVHIALGTPGPSAVAPERFAAAVLNLILGGNMSSRLFQEVRERRGLAYSVYSYLSSYSDSGILGVYLGVPPDRAAEAVRVVRQEMANLAQKPISEQELKEAKDCLSSSILLSAENPDTRMSRLARNEYNFGRDIPLEEVRAQVDAVSLDDLSRAAGTLLDQSKLAATVLGPVDGDELAKEIGW